jgi:hypothetical protein
MAKYKDPLATRAVKAKCQALMDAGQDPKVAAKNALAWAERTAAHKAADERLGKRVYGGKGQRISRSAEVRRGGWDRASINGEAAEAAAHAANCFMPFTSGTCSQHGWALSTQWPYGWSSNAGAIDGTRAPAPLADGELAEADQPLKGRVSNPDQYLIGDGVAHVEALDHLKAQAAARNRRVLKRKKGS